VSYEEIIKMAEGVPVFIETTIENDFKISPSQNFKMLLLDKTKMMIYSSPCNPSGSVYSKEELRSLADVLGTITLQYYSSK
jgi:aspartate aminotransferase